MWTIIILVIGILIIATVFDKWEKSKKQRSQNSTNDVKETKLENVKIGKQVWMAKNLNVSHYRNGDAIPEAKTVDEWKEAKSKGIGVWCYYDNDPNNGEKYGKLYNWFAVNAERGLAPKGWHIPNKDEWFELGKHLGGAESNGFKLKSTTEWKDDEYSTNESGFSALPGGHRVNIFSRKGLGYEGGWWSSSEADDKTAVAFSLDNFHSYLNSSREYKGTGYSVRCIRNQ
jgi:uncharacterized protein (TIGR02145 family)